NRPARPGVNRLRLTQVLEVDGAAFHQIQAIRDKVGYTAIDLTNDSQPDDPPRLAAESEVGISRAVFRRSGQFGRSVRIDEADLSRNLSAVATAA
ncbi:capsule biosynthesis protein CapA, partial [Sinorhizobium meliloti]